jgi:very-short-patch-repair endonuclease
MAASERRLWNALRSRRFGEQKFRRQVPTGPIIADFACKAARLIIEVDGETHVDPAQAVRDARRTQWLESHGWRVIRFWTGDLVEMKRVLESIDLALSLALADRPHPALRATLSR